MTDFQSLQRQLAAALTAGASQGAAPPGRSPAGPAPGAAAPGMMPELTALIDALPYYGDSGWNAAFRGGLVNLLGTNLPDAKIAAQPQDTAVFYPVFYFYDGPYGGYADAFFHGLVRSAAANAIQASVLTANPGLVAPWWGVYALALLTDAARAAAAVPVDSARLATALSNCDSTLRPALSAAFLAVATTGFGPTSTAFAALTASGRTAQAATQLADAIRAPTFIANVNQSISMGGDSTNAAVWFLYNNWVVLRALGADADAAIAAAQAAGLTVPPEIAPGLWWTGGYTAWFIALSGADVAPVTGGRLTEDMPEIQSMATGGLPVTNSISAPNGYSCSLVDWGPLATFAPPPASCLGAGTGILMADGRSVPVEEVRVGDLVWTEGGPRAVALVESPPLGGRPLVQVDRLSLYVTQGHPLRCHRDGGPRYAAAGAWLLRDATPTMTENGVVELAPGVELRAVRDGGIRPLVVQTLTGHAPHGEDAKVYDLLLKDWERDRPAYFAGGPDVFVAVEAETSDPLREPASSVALLTALDRCVPASRAGVPNPGTALPRLVAGLAPLAHLAPAMQAAWQAPDGPRPPAPAIPGPDFYMTDGTWEPHASMLEVYLLRRFARPWRRMLATGWRGHQDGRKPGDHLTFLMHDLEIAGEVALPPGMPVEVSLSLADGSAGAATARLEATPKPARRWHPRFDAIADLGPCRPDALAALTVACRCGDLEIGRAHVPVGNWANGMPATEFFLHDSASAVRGRLAFDCRWLDDVQRQAEAEARGRWSKAHVRRAADAAGRHAGDALAASITRS